MWWLAAAALAQDPPPPDPAAELEITVWGELAVLKARDEITAELEALGWRPRRRPGRTVFKGPKGWMGAAIVDDDGTLSFRAPVLGFAPRPSEEWAYDPRQDEISAGPNDLRTEVGLGPTFQIGASRRKLAPVRAEVVRAIEDELENYRGVLRRTAFEEQLRALPDRLDLLWREGVPLQPGASLASAEARRLAVLEHWATRADTSEGRRVAGAIEAWLDAVVQESEHPITAEERARFEAMRGDDRTLPH